MYKTVLLVFILFIVLLLVPTTAVADLADLASRTRTSVVVVNTLDHGGRRISQGSGFFVSQSGRVVTNHHVVEEAANATVTLADGSTRRALGLLADNPDKDIAVLQIEGGGYPPLSLGQSKPLKPGDDVIVIGSPVGFSGTLSTGIVSAIRERGVELEGKPIERATSWGIQITAAISPGSSGSPVLDREGNVVGVAVGTYAAGQNLNFAVPIDVAKAMLERLAADAPAMPFARAHKSDLARNLLVSAGVLGLLLAAYVVWGRLETKRERRR